MGRSTGDILVLGGYGNTGSAISRLLLQETPVHVVIAGRDLQKAIRFAQQLNAQFGQNRAAGVYLDAGDPTGLEGAFSRVGFVIVASSTAQYARQVASAALNAGIDYLDVQYSSAKRTALQSLETQIRSSGRFFVTDAGFHPGLPAALVRYAGAQFDRLQKAVVGSVIKIDWAGLDIQPATMQELASEMLDYQSRVYKNGHWKTVSMTSVSDILHMDFGAPFGSQACFPMFLEELRSLPDLYPGLQETGFFVGGFNWFVDWIGMPIAMIALKLSPRRMLAPAASFLDWGLRKFSRPPYGTRLKIEASGISAGLHRTFSCVLSHPDGYQFTAIPVVACMLQYLDGAIGEPGLWYMGRVLEPARLLADMQRMGISVEAAG